MSEKKFGVVPADILLSHTGLDFLQGVVDGRLPAPPIAETLGFALVTVEKGRAIFEGVPQQRHYNPIGVVHGGFAMTLLDSALERHWLGARGRTRAASRTHGQHGGRRDQGCRRQALRARHDDVHDLPGKE
jgi:hypothetical protein